MSVRTTRRAPVYWRPRSAVHCGRETVVAEIFRAPKFDHSHAVFHRLTTNGLVCCQPQAAPLSSLVPENPQ